MNDINKFMFRYYYYGMFRNLCFWDFWVFWHRVLAPSMGILSSGRVIFFSPSYGYSDLRSDIRPFGSDFENFWTWAIFVFEKTPRHTKPILTYFLIVLWGYAFWTWSFKLQKCFTKYKLQFALLLLKISFNEIPRRQTRIKII